MLYGPPAEARREAEVQAEYQALMEVICKSDTPDALAARGGDLDDFSEKHPNVVDADLEELVAACDEYEYGDRDDKDTFESMKLTLERLENSDISLVADCAAKLLVGVTEEYDAFVERVAAEEAAAAAAAEDEEDDGPEIMGPPASAPFPEPVPYELVTDFAVVDDDFYHYEFLNTSDLTIEYIETWIFCYDENGNPIDGDPIDDGLANVEWTIDYPALDAGALYTLADYEATGFYKFSRCEGTVYALPFISFVKFSDGTYWGITDYTEDDDTYIADVDDVIDQMYGMREIADEYVAMTIGAPNDD